MSRVTEAGMDGASEEDVQRVGQRAVVERETRWSARRKEGVVMRLLRGESLDLLSVGAAYGVLVIVFQWGWLDSLLNYKLPGTSTP